MPRLHDALKKDKWPRTRKKLNYQGKQDNRTIQSFKDETDINKLLAKQQVPLMQAHYDVYGEAYSDFDGFDFFEAQVKLADAKTIFEKLPSEVRKEFGHNPGAFFQYANDPDNVGRLTELLPAIARPGIQMHTPDTGPRPSNVAEGDGSEPEASETPPPPDAGTESGG